MYKNLGVHFSFRITKELLPCASGCQRYGVAEGILDENPISSHQQT
jgi:hypothetical protein